MTTEWDIGPRGNGKTTRLIERAHKENLYIIVPTRARALDIAERASKAKKNILFPVTIKEMPFKMLGHNPYCLTHDGVLVDDVGDILEAIIGMPVLAAASYGKLHGGGEEIDRLMDTNGKLCDEINRQERVIEEQAERIRELESLVRDWSMAPCAVCDPWDEHFACEHFDGHDCTLGIRMSELGLEAGR